MVGSTNPKTLKNFKLYKIYNLKNIFYKVFIYKMSIVNLLSKNNFAVFNKSLVVQNDNDYLLAVTSETTHVNLVASNQDGDGGVMHLRCVSGTGANNIYLQLNGISDGSGNIQCKKDMQFESGYLTVATRDTTGGARSVSAAQLLDGYIYDAAAGSSVALTLPDKADVLTEMGNRGIVPSAGMVLPDLVANVTDANALTLTAGTGGAVDGTVAVNNKCAIFKVVLTGNDGAYIAYGAVSA